MRAAEVAWGVLPKVGMHRLLFTTKRVWWAIAREYWSRWEKLGITHARYDFLLVVAPNGEGGITQARMARDLGVSRAATSKMAKLLTKLKLLRRDYIQDRRTLSLRLTDLGKEVLERVRHKIDRPSFVHSSLEHSLRERKDPRRALGDVICDFEAIAYSFNSRVRFVYPSPYPDPYLLANARLLRDHAEPDPPSAPDVPTPPPRKRAPAARRAPQP